MIVSSVYLISSIWFAIAAEIPSDVSPVTLDAYNFAIDTSNIGSLDVFQCIQRLGYKTAFIQVYNPSNSGSLTSYSGQNLIAASNAGLGTEIYVTPSPSGKRAYQQFDEAYNSVRSNGINVVKIWLQITSSIDWPVNEVTNIEFIQGFVDRAKSYGVAVGIYTNWYDWLLITGNAVQFYHNVDLWYWAAYGIGPSAIGVADFSDFRYFGGWSKAAIKQFALNESLCGIYVNRSIYPPGVRSHKTHLQNKRVNDTFKYIAGGFV